MTRPFLTAAAVLALATPAFAQDACPAPDMAEVAAALPGDWTLHLQGGTQTVAGAAAALVPADPAPLPATVEAMGDTAVLNAGDLGPLGLYWAVEGETAPLGAIMPDGTVTYVDTAIVGPCDPADLPRLIGGGTGVTAETVGVEVTLDLYAFAPDLYSGSLTVTRGDTVVVRIVTMGRPQ